MFARPLIALTGTCPNNESSQPVMATNLMVGVSKETFVWIIVSVRGSYPKVNWIRSSLNNLNKFTNLAFKSTFTGFSNTKLFTHAPLVNVIQPSLSI